MYIHTNDSEEDGADVTKFEFWNGRNIDDRVVRKREI